MLHRKYQFAFLSIAFEIENAPTYSLSLQSWALSNPAYKKSGKWYPKAHRPSTALESPNTFW